MNRITASTINTEEGRELSKNISSTAEYNPPSTPPTSTQPSHSLSPSGSRERQAVVTFTWGEILKNHLDDHYNKFLILVKAVLICILVLSFSVLMLYKVFIYIYM